MQPMASLEARCRGLADHRRALGERPACEVPIRKRVQQLCRGCDLLRRHRVRHQALDLIRNADLGCRPRQEACLHRIRAIRFDRRNPRVAERLEGALLLLAQHTHTGHDRHGLLLSSPHLRRGDTALGSS
jgi:hypothetical protein